MSAEAGAVAMLGITFGWGFALGSLITFHLVKRLLRTVHG